jgi:hypothetical protein
MELNSDAINARTGVGAVIGGVVGFAFGGPLGAGLGMLIGGGVAHASNDAPKGVMTPKRQLIFSKAMESMKEPEELCKLADAYEGEGLRAQAIALRKRAKLRELPLEVKDKRRIAFRKSMACDDPDLILKIAKAFQDEGAYDAAKSLKDHAEAVRAAHAAGKSAKSMARGSVSQFADKLGKALIHFGPASNQAKTAARNLISARGKTPSDDLIAEVIRIATEALKIETPPASVEPAEPIEIETPGSVDDAAVETAAADAAETVPPVEAPPAAAPAPAPVKVAGEEATVVGPPARDIEPPVVAQGVTVDSGAPVAMVAEGTAEVVTDGAGETALEATA